MSPSLSRRRWLAWLGRALVWGAAAAMLSLFVLPLIALVAAGGPGGLVEGLSHPLVWPALRLSLVTSLIALVATVCLGTPLAWLLSRRDSPGILETVVRLPLVLPPAVVGVALLLSFGRSGLLGDVLGAVGVRLPFSTAAVVVAQTFVAAPFFVEAATAAFRRVDRDLIEVARTVGAGPLQIFGRIVVPLSWEGLVGGAAMAWARALGEFGATLMFAGNLRGVTQTLPLAIYTAMEGDLSAARSMSVVLVVVAFGLLLGLRALGLHRSTRAAGGRDARG